MKDLHRNEQAVIEALPLTNGKATTRERAMATAEIAEKSGVRHKDIHSTCARLQKRGLIHRCLGGDYWSLTWPDGYRYRDPVRYKEMNE